MIKVGSGDIGKMYVGSTEIAKAYVGSQLVYESGSALPYDAQVEYLESTGTQYINTGIVMTSRNIELEIKLKWTGTTVSDFESFFAFMKNGGVVPRGGLHKYQGYWMFGTNATKSTGVSVDNNIHTFQISGNASSNSETLFIDSVSIGTATTSSTAIGNNTMPFFAFARNRNGSVDNIAKCRIYSIKYVVYNNGQHSNAIEKHELIPVRVGSVGYLYDKESRQFHSNVGSGSFVLGNDVTI